MGEETVSERELVKLTPGTKIYKLFKYKRVLVEGNRESFLIKIEKIPTKHSFQTGPRAGK